MSNRKKIAHVIHGFPPHSNAGAETYTYKLALEQAKTCEVAVFTRLGSPKGKEYSLSRETREGLDVWSVNNNLSRCRSFEETYTNPPVAGIFGRFLDEVRPDVVHIGHLTMLSTLIVEEIARRNIPTIMTLHDYWLICPRGQLIDRDLKICRRPEDAKCAQCQRLQLAISPASRAAFNAYGRVTGALRLSGNFLRGPLRKLYSLFSRGEKSAAGSADMIRRRREHILSICESIDSFIAPSNFLRDKFIEFGLAPERVAYSDYGFDSSPFAQFQREPSDKIRFGFVGSIIPSKGLHILIEAFKGIDTNAAELNVFGGFSQYYEFDEYPEQIRALADTPGVNMRGAYLAERIAEVFSQIDVLVVPSIWYENSPLVIHEAFMAGAPVITSNEGGMAELVEDGKSGLVFELGEAGSLRRAMKKIADEPSLIEHLRTGIPEVKTIERDAAEMSVRYAGLERK